MYSPTRISIGSCAWSFEDWRGAFYPEHLPAGERLAFYARHFGAVEIDSTFYHAPSPAVAEHWLEVTPPDFVFTAKVPREITHERKLRESQAAMGEFLAAISPLRPKLACVLIQLPPYFHVKQDELALREFLQDLPAGWRFAVEFRQHEWHLPRIAHLLEGLGICWTWSDLTPLDHAPEGPFEFMPETADFSYVRLMGELETKYRGDGTRIHRYRALEWPRDGALESWAVRIRQRLATCKRVLVFANNHYEGFSPHTCARLAEKLGVAAQLPTPEELLGQSASDAAQLHLL